MKSLVTYLVICILFCSLVVNSQETTTHIDFVGTYADNQSHLLTRVEKKVDIKFKYALNNDNTYSQFQGMFIEFELQFAQYVSIKYTINLILTATGNFFSTKVLIDGKEDTDFRQSSGFANMHVSHRASEDVWLSAGKHSAVVQYRSTHSNIIIGESDWSNAYFKIKYFKK